MGLATLSAPPLKGRARIVWTAELEPRYSQTIDQNYARFARWLGDKDQIPTKCEPIDLASETALAEAGRIKKLYGNIHLMVAGPPCQGFSLANRRTRTHDNPKNALSLRLLDYVAIMSPDILILENVPGIRTMKPTSGPGASTTEILQNRLNLLGYHSMVSELDAAAFGVPQFRLRAFLIAAKTGTVDNIGALNPTPTHGPGRLWPFVTVKDALSDIPPTTNGNCKSEFSYALAAQTPFQARMREAGLSKFSDHLTSKHSPYVLDRYAAIGPGQNWTSIASSLTNYADVERTHMNIYHRLDPNRPARTIGNFRKAMTIHPWENRGLSLREAARLQSIPDWFSFYLPKPITRDVVPGLNAYQQQIGNAASYLLTESLVSHVAKTLLV